MEPKADSTLLVGNARHDGTLDGNWGWFVGRFIDPARGLCRTDGLEVKWGEHAAGEARERASRSAAATTLTLLIRGRFVVQFPEHDKAVTLKEAGDYVIYPPGVLHAWQVLEDCVVLTVRWPSC